MAILYGRAGRLTVKNGGSRPGPNKEGLAADLLELALQNNPTGFTQDWEFGAAFHWDGTPLQHFTVKLSFDSLLISASLRNYYAFPVKT